MFHNKSTDCRQAFEIKNRKNLCAASLPCRLQGRLQSAGGPVAALRGIESGKVVRLPQDGDAHALAPSKSLKEYSVWIFQLEEKPRFSWNVEVGTIGV